MTSEWRPQNGNALGTTARAWYDRVLENPAVSVTRNAETTDYCAVPVSEDESERLLDSL